MRKGHARVRARAGEADEMLGADVGAKIDEPIRNQPAVRLARK